MNATFGTLEQLARASAAAKGFQALGSFAERHGSGEISFHKRQDLDRFASFALTEVRGSCDVESWAGADDGVRFVRKLISQFNTGGRRPDDPALWPRIREVLERAMEAADRLESSDLTEACLPSRSTPRRATGS